MANTSNTNEPNDSELCPHCKGLRYVRADVPVDHPDFGQLLPCSCHLAELSQRRADTLRAISNLDALDRMTFDTFEPQRVGLLPEEQENLRRAYDSAYAFAENPSGWLLLKGGFGCGKTHLAAAIANRCIERGQGVLFITAPDLLDHLRATFSPTSPTAYDERFDQIRTAALLIVDDLGTESSTPWAQEKLFQIFNHRYAAQLPTIITTNHELEEIPLRLRSRLLDADLVSKIYIVAPDYRRPHADRYELGSLDLHLDQTFDAFDLRQRELAKEKAENLNNAFEIARDFAAQPEGWLTFLGDHGCGKTHLAAAIANERTQQGRPVLFITIPDLLDYLRAAFSPQSIVPFDKRFEQVRRAPFLVLDDLGTESATPWAREKLYQVFDYRYNARLPTVITMAENIDKIDSRLRSRILDVGRCKIYEIEAPAYRGGGTRRRGKRRP